MTIEAALAAKLKAVLGHNRVYPDAIPDTIVEADEWPCVVYSRSGENDLIGLNESAQPRDHEDTYSLTIWDRDRAPLLTARDLLRSTFAGFNAQGAWDSTVWVAGCVAKDAVANVQPAEDGTDRHKRAESLTLKINWTRTGA